MVHILFWIIFGGLIGLVASILKEDARLSWRSYALACVGAAGGLIGGLTALFINPDINSYDGQAGGLLFAILGAIAFVVITPLIYHKVVSEPSDHKQSATRDAKRQSD